MRLRVCFLGNMNNNFFSLVRYLREKGIDATLYLYNTEQPHFHPSADTFSLDYMEYVQQLEWGGLLEFRKTPRKTILRDIKGFDILVGCGLAPAYFYRFKKALDIFKPYGADIWESTKFKLTSPHRIIDTWYAVYCQRLGIGCSHVFHMAKTNTLYEEQFQRFRGHAERWHEGMPMIYAPEYVNKDLGTLGKKSHWFHEFQRIRAKSDLMVVAHMRHVWGLENDPSVKGFNILLLGWKAYLERNRDVRSSLILVEYGRDVAKSRRFIEELGIGHTICWFPKMLRKDIMPGLMLADVVCGEFANSWIASGVLFEALVAKKPILAWRKDELYNSDYTSLYPILNAKDAEGICKRLEEFMDNREGGRMMGDAGYDWYLSLVRDCLSKYLLYFEKTASILGKSLL